MLNITPYVMKMIAVFLVLSASVLTLAAQQQIASVTKSVSVAPSESATFRWMETTFDFGVVLVNHPATHEFSFTNNGKVPLVIASVQASCGCTVTEYSKEPVLPGSTGSVKATYSASRVGVFSKTVTVNANAENESVILTLTGDVRE